MRCTIGRAPTNKVVLTDDLCSREHGEIYFAEGKWMLRDLGSLNGTYIAGSGKLGRDQLYKLKDRDQVVLGGAILQFRRG